VIVNGKSKALIDLKNIFLINAGVILFGFACLLLRNESSKKSLKNKPEIITGMPKKEPIEASVIKIPVTFSAPGCIANASTSFVSKVSWLDMFCFSVIFSF